MSESKNEAVNAFEKKMIFREIIHFLKPTTVNRFRYKPLSVPFIKIEETFNAREYFQNLCTEKGVDFVYIDCRQDIDLKLLWDLGYVNRTYGNSKPAEANMHTNKSIALFDHFSDADSATIYDICNRFKYENNLPEEQKSNVCPIVTYSKEFERYNLSYIIHAGFAFWIP